MDLKRCAETYNLNEELAETQANVVTASRELATLYLKVDPQYSGVGTAKVLVKKTLFYLHRIYTQVGLGRSRGGEENLLLLQW